MTIAIYLNKAAAQTYADKVHVWLMKNRKGYNAVRWCDVETGKSDIESHLTQEYYVKIPFDYEILNAKIPLAKDRLVLPTVTIVDKLPDDWRKIEIEQIKPK